jgi:hypothetical protein
MCTFVIWPISPCLVLPLSSMACPSKSLVGFMDGYIFIGHLVPCPSLSSIHFVVVCTSTMCVASLIIPTMPPWLVKLAPNTLAFDYANNFVMNNSTWTFNCSIPWAFELHAFRISCSFVWTVTIHEERMVKWESCQICMHSPT